MLSLSNRLIHGEEKETRSLSAYGLVPLEFKWEITIKKKVALLTCRILVVIDFIIMCHCLHLHHVYLLVLTLHISLNPSLVSCNLYIFFNLLIKRARFFFVGYELFLSSYYVIKLIFYPKDLIMWSLFSFYFIFIFKKRLSY